MTVYILAISRRTKDHDYSEFEGLLVDTDAKELMPGAWVIEADANVMEAMKDLDEILGARDRYMVFQITTEAQWAVVRVGAEAAALLSKLLDSE